MALGTPSRWRRAWAGVGMAALAVAAAPPSGCGTTFVPVGPSEPVAASTPGLRVAVSGVLLRDDALAREVDDGTALVVELSIENDGPLPFTVSTAAIACWMELDARYPGETLSLTPAGGGDGAFPGEEPHAPAPFEPHLAAGERRSFWVLFRGYRYPGSDRPRRITLKVPAPAGGTLDLHLADPARGHLRWDVAPPRAGWNIAIETTTLLGSRLRADGPATVLVHRKRIGPFMLDLGLASTVLIEREGGLASSTSSFTASGLTASLVWPVLRWGSEREPRELGIFAGGAAHLLAEIPSQSAIEARASPHFYGAGAAEVGLDIGVGARRFVATPFPLSAAGRALPRWSARIGYTRWWLDGGSSDGYVNAIQLAW